MRFIGGLDPKNLADQRLSRHVGRPRFGQYTRERKQHGSCSEGNSSLSGPNHIPAGIDDKLVRRQQRFDFLEQERAFLAFADQACCGGIEAKVGAFDFGHERRHAGLTRTMFSSGQRSACRFRL